MRFSPFPWLEKRKAAPEVRLKSLDPEAAGFASKYVV